MEDDDVDVRKSKSPVRKTLDLISMMRELHRFFNTGTAGQVSVMSTDTANIFQGDCFRLIKFSLTNCLSRQFAGETRDAADSLLV